MTNTRIQWTRKIAEHLEDLPSVQALLGSVKWAWLWLLARCYLGAVWLQAGWRKITNPTWLGSDDRKALTGYTLHALTKASRDTPGAQAWYAAYRRQMALAHAHLWSCLVSFGEVLMGAALILGIFTGIAPFFGLFMSESYLLTGAVGINPIMPTLAILTALTWKVTGWWGFDRWLFPALGTPWKPGPIFQEHGRHSQSHHFGGRTTSILTASGNPSRTRICGGWK